MSNYAGMITSLIDNLGSGMMRGDSPAAEVPSLSPSAARGVRRYELGVRNDLFCINGYSINTKKYELLHL
eukprot:COSAG02_NODE_898_length_16108_cov_5.877444_12_plen_70_part_00